MSQKTSGGEPAQVCEIRSPSRVVGRALGIGGLVRERLNHLNEALAMPASRRTSKMDVKQCREFHKLVTKAAATDRIEPMDRDAALSLMAWLDKRQAALEASLPDLASAVLKLRDSSRWLTYYEGPTDKSPSSSGPERGHKRPSKLPGYIPPGRSGKIGVSTRVDAETYALLTEFANVRGMAIEAVVRELIEHATSMIKTPASPLD